MKTMKIKKILYRWFLRFVLGVYLALLKLVSLRSANTTPVNSKQLTVVITGTFFSDNWLISHLRPLAGSEIVSEVIMVSNKVVPSIPGVRHVSPPPKLKAWTGDVPSRLLTFMWVCVQERPDYIAAFHLLLNGLVAIIMARLLRKKSIYFCGGGPREVLGGGYTTESKIFNKLGGPDDKIESQLLKAVQSNDVFISMGQGAVEYFGPRTHWAPSFEINPGGYDTEVFYPDSQKPSYDMVLVGRLSQVKRVDIFLRATKKLKLKFPNIRALVVGAGPDLEVLQKLASDLELSNNVHFAGWQSDVEHWLRRSKVFVLTSDSEGLSQALIQAMMCGLPAVVSSVGDLSDVVVDGENGYLIDSRQPENFSDKLEEIFSNQGLYDLFRHSALKSTERFMESSVSKQWTNLFESEMGFNKEEKSG